MFRTASRYLGPLALLVVYVPFHTSAQPVVAQKQDAAIEAKSPGIIENLVSIQQSIELKQNTIRKLNDQLKKPVDTSDKQEIEQKIERIKNEILNLRQSFEHIVLGGINLSSLTDQTQQRINWQDEIEQISRPLLSTLKELTAKPRQIDSLQRDIEQLKNQQKVIAKALESIRSFKQPAFPPVAAEPINQMLVDWEQRRDDSARALEITRIKLNNLRTGGPAWYTTAGDAITEFIRGRGLTLLLATIIGLAIWLISKGLLKVYWRWLFRTRHDIGVTQAPLLYYSHRLATAVIMVLAILMVLYIRGDVLLLTLALIALAGAALTLRQTLPRYAAEIRLLLGVGPVREDERIVFDGIPFKVESLGVYSVLRNPALEGSVRLPLHTMIALTSRPAGQEPWFPCLPEDYILLSDGSLGRVLRQTIELVEIAILDSTVQIRSRDFIGQNLRNLSRNGFGIVSTFGIDYQHQAICLDTIPNRFREAIIARFEQAGLEGDVKDILVEFKSAGASSLDYQIYTIFNGHAAYAFFKLQRLIQQACVEACNREGWVIPFTQITIHSSR